MDQNQDQGPNNSKQKFVVAFVMLAAIVIVALGVTFFQGKNAESSSDAPVNAQSTNPSSTTSTSFSSSSSSSATSSPSDSSVAASEYKDGTYSASGSYVSPGGKEKLDLSLTVKDGVVTGSTVTQVANNRDSANYQTKFREGYKPFVIGKPLSEISLSRVSGSSLTSQGFNEALEDIKSQANS